MFNSSDATEFAGQHRSFLQLITFNNTGTGLITVAGNPIALAGAAPTVTVSGRFGAITSV